MKRNGNISNKAPRAKNGKSITCISVEHRRVEKALQSAVREAIRDHKRAGNPICVWRNGKVVWIPPEKIKV